MKGYSFGFNYATRHLDAMSCLRRGHIPSLQRVCTRLLLSVLLIGFAILWLPWVQTTAGMGSVTTMNPGDRVQNINALVGGRVAEWFVQESDQVSAGDPIVRIQDIDIELVPRLQSQLDAATRRLQAAREALETAEINYQRQQDLFAEGLLSRLDAEQARIRVRDRQIALEEATAALNQAQVNLSRQGSQLVTAPRDGTILHVEAGDTSTLVTPGQPLATFMPANAERVVEIFLEGRDIGLVAPGRRVRLQFEGWPAFQFSGMPQIAVGTFAAEVVFVQPAAELTGRFRVVVREPANAVDCTRPRIENGLPRNNECGWPPESFIRLGAKVRGWVQLETVPLGYELWRLLNGFPPINTQPLSSTTGGGNA